MSAATPMRRGACPGLTSPMPTGDGLPVRLMPVGTISLDAMAAFCAAALEQGSGIIDITSRGSLQVRGLSEASAAKFAAAVAQLGIAAQEGVSVISDPLAGLDPDEVIDAGAQRGGVTVAVLELGVDAPQALERQPLVPGCQQGRSRRSEEALQALL